MDIGIVVLCVLCCCGIALYLFLIWSDNNSRTKEVVDLKQRVKALEKEFNESKASPRDEMDADLEELGVPQGEIESILTHWNNKYLITRK